MRGEGSGLAAGEKGLGGKNIPSIPSPSRPEKGTGSEPPLLAMVLLLFGSETPFERMMKVMHPPPRNSPHKLLPQNLKRLMNTSKPTLS